jgi:hypothetical protein
MITRKIAIPVIHRDLFGNSKLQIGQTDALESISIAQEGHSLVFTGDS